MRARAVRPNVLSSWREVSVYHCLDESCAYQMSHRVRSWTGRMSRSRGYQGPERKFPFLVLEFPQLVSASNTGPTRHSVRPSRHDPHGDAACCAPTSRLPADSALHSAMRLVFTRGSAPRGGLYRRGGREMTLPVSRTRLAMESLPFPRQLS